MRHLNTLLLLLLALSASAQDYYWVGGTGNWSDFASHWATTSGGTTFHTVAPTELDHVYFDANSFDATGQELSINEEAFCNDMDWTGVTNSPSVIFVVSDNLNVYGSFTLSDDMVWEHRYIDFESDNMGNTISIGSTANFTASGRLSFRGSGSWILQDSLVTNEINTFGGTLDLNDQYLDLFSFYVNSISTVDLSNSEIHTVNFRNNTVTTAVQASTSTLYVSNSFYAGGSTYSNVVLTEPLNTTTFHQDDAIIDTLTLTPSANVEFESGTTLTVNVLIAEGTKTETIGLYTDPPGTAATISQATGTVNAQYLIMEDITATGGATFNATNSIDNGNNTGWIITAPVPLDYFWVGGTGNWSDYSGHWATTSGGTTMHAEPPGNTDNVFFDANSFDAAGQEVTIDVEAFCNSMDWTGVTNAPLVKNLGSVVLNIHGSFTLFDGIQWEYFVIDFESDDTGNTIAIGATDKISISAAFHFRGVGSWTLQDSLDVNIINSYDGSLNLNGQYVEASNFYLYNTSTVDLSNSEIHVANFRDYTGGSPVVAGTSTLYVSSSFYAGANTYHDVVLANSTGSTILYQDNATINTLTLAPGNDVNLESGSTITVTELVAAGTKAAGIELHSSTTGSVATISQTTGTVDGQYLTLQDISATGGATFNATNSIDNGNNTGWTITAPLPLDYYWVGNTGDWSDFANHWATTSGGTTMHTDVPGNSDNVYFDGNSFDIASTVTLDINANCTDMDWTGLDSDVTLNRTSANNLSVYGSLTMHELVSSNLGNIYFESDDLAQTITTANKYLANKIWFTGTGGWMFMDSVETFNLAISSGTLDFNDQTVELGSRFDVDGSQAKSMDFGNATIFTRDFYYTGSGLTLDAGTSTVVFQGTGSDMRANGSGDITYHDVVIEGFTSIDLYDYIFNTLKLKPGATLEIGAGDTITVNSLVGLGAALSPITIKSDDVGDQAILKILSGTQEVNYANIQDINATGGATFNAIESTDNGNNTGWNFISDVIAPSFIATYPSIDTVGGSQAHINVRLDELATVYYVVLPPSAAAPTAAQIIAGTDASDTEVIRDSLFVSASNVTAGLLVTGLMELQSYDLYFALQDDAGNIQSSVEMLSVTTIDDSAPTFVTTYPIITTIGGTNLGFRASIDELGVIYYVLLADSSTAPSSAQIKAGNDASDLSALAFGDIAATATEVYDRKFTGLTEVTAYDIYMVAEDTTGNLSSVPVLLESTTTVSSLDYYWVGGTGNWSDFANHWATTSGGTTFHTIVPTEFDHVYFDSNSFDTIGQELLIDNEAFCNDMDWTGVTNVPLVKVSGNIVLNVHGSFTLSDDMTWDHRNIDFESNNTDNTISTGLTSNSTASLAFSFFGTGSWVLQDSLDVSQISTFNGTLDLNGQYVDAFGLYLYNSSSSVDLSSSEIYAVNFRNYGGAPSVVANSSVIYVSNSFYAGGSTYNEVVISKPFNTTVFYEGDATINTLTFTPGTNVSLESGSTITVTELVVEGTKAEGIELYADTPGTAVTISQSTGTVNGQYLTMQDINVTSGATFNATNSIDNGNNIGWTITAPTPLDYYWVGNGGNWSDYTNHWATASGGTTMHTDVPGLLDNVYFDANSFDEPSTVTLDINANSADMNWTGLDSEVSLVTSDSESLSVFGSLTMHELLSSELSDLYFESDELTETITTANSYIADKMLFTGTGGWMLMDSVEASSLEMTSGNLDFNDQVLDLSSRFDVSSTLPKTMDFGNATIYVTDYFDFSSGLTLDASTSTLVLRGTNSDMRGNPSGDIVFNNVVIEGSTDLDFYNHTFNSLELKPGAFLNMGAGDTLTVTSLVGTGTLLTPITIISDNAGSQAMLRVTSGTQEITYAALQDINAFGGATFNAYASTDNGNNTGWSFIKLDQTITFDAFETKTFGDDVFELTAAINSSLSPTYTSSDESVATIAGTTVTIVGAGTTTITASQAGDDDHNPALDVEQVLTINKAEQIITFEAVTDRMFGDVPFELAGTGGASANPVIFTSSDETVATILGTTLTIVGAGSVTITASQAADDNHNPALDVAQVLTIDKAEQVITFEALSDRIFGDVPFELSVTGGASSSSVILSSSDEAVATISGTTLTIVGVGSVTITASQAGDDNFNMAASVDQSFTVNTADQIITFDELNDKTFGDAPFDLLATGGTSGNAVVFTSSDETVATIAGTTVTIIGAGTATITASQSGNDNHNAASNVERVLTVNKADQVITFDVLLDVDINVGTVNLSATASSSLAVNFSLSSGAATLSGSVLTLTGIGVVEVSASQLGNDNYNAAIETQSFNVTDASKTDQTITFDALSTKTFGDAPFELSATGGTSGNEVTFASSNEAVVTILGMTVTIVGAGIATITASQEGNDDHNAASNVEQVLTVNKADQFITFDLLDDKIFGDTPFELSAIGGTSGNEVLFTSSDETVATISGITIAIVGAGTATITATQAADDNYNAASNVEQILTVNKAGQVITFDAITDKTFGEIPFELFASGGASGNPITFTSSDEAVVTISGITATIVGAGTATITASQVGDTNHDVASNVEQSLTVNKADQVITFDALPDVDTTVGTVILSATASSGLSVNFSLVSGAATLEGMVLSLTGAGIIEVSATQAGNENYNAANVTQSFNVTDASKTDQTITFDALPTKTFGNVPFELSATGGGSGNVVAFTSSDETVATIVGATVTITGAGTATITASQAGSDTHNAASNVEQVLIVNKVDQVITFDAVTDKTFGEIPFELSATGGSSGNQVTFTSSDESVATIAGTTVTIIGAGTTTITALQLGNDDYSAAVNVEQSLTVNKADQVITFDAVTDKTFGEIPFELSATGGSSGNQVTFTSSDESVATIAGTTVTIIGSGTTTITALQLGNDDYSAAVNEEQSLTVNKADQVITFDVLPDVDISVGTVNLSATASSNLAVTFSLTSGAATLGGSVLTLTGIGIVEVSASQSGNDNFNAAIVTQSFNVTDASKTDQTITFDALPAKTFGDASFELSATGGGSGNAVTFASSDEAVVTIAGATVTITGAGTVTITASQAGNDTHNAASNVEQILTVNKAGQVITFDAITDKTFGEIPFELSATGGSSGNQVTFTSSDESVATIAGTTVTIISAGTFTITASQSGDDNHNSAADVARVLTVNKADQVITFDALSDVDVNTATVSLVASSNSGLDVTFSLVSGPATLLGSELTLTGTGVVVIRATQLGNDNYNPAEEIIRDFNVTDADKTNQTITFDALPEKTFGDAPFELSAVGGASGNPVIFTSSDESVAIISGTTVTILGAGTVTITASQDGDNDHNAASNVEQVLTISKSSQTIIITDIADKTVDDEPFEVVATVNSGLDLTYVVSGPATILGTAITLAGTAGVVTIIVSQAGDINYLETSATVSFDVEGILSARSGGVEELVSLYPNPFANTLNIELAKTATVRLVTIEGIVLLERKMQQGSLDLTELSAGLYLLQIVDGDQVSIHQIIKNN